MRWIVLVTGVGLSACSSLLGDGFEGYSVDECRPGTDRSCADASVASGGGRGLGGAGGVDGHAGAGHGAGSGGASGGPVVAAGGDSGAGSGGRVATLQDAGHDGDADSSSDGSDGSLGADGQRLEAGSEGGDGAGELDASDAPPPGPPSCLGIRENCGPGGVRYCCEDDPVPGGAFIMGRDDGPTAARPAHVVHVSPFRLDRYEVTVERFRRFTEELDGWRPGEDQGALPGQPGTGWSTAWNDFLPPTPEALVTQVKCTYAGPPMFTDEPLEIPTAMNCLNWYVAYAFCLWDGGRLPTEAEWEFAAAGGPAHRDYPWGNTWYDGYANYAGPFPLPVGQTGGLAGRSIYGQFDLMGNVWEWTRDIYDPAFYGRVAAADRALDPVNPFSGIGVPAVRGGSWYYSIARPSSYERSTEQADTANASIGVRCARSP